MLENKANQRLKVSKTAFYKKCAPKLVFLNEKKIEKDLDDF